MIISVLCETLQSTTDIIVNLTSTAMGSIANYQCRDGSSDVYSTQCTSDGVWEPNPNSTHCTDTGDGVWELNPNSTVESTPPGITPYAQFKSKYIHIVVEQNVNM